MFCSPAKRPWFHAERLAVKINPLQKIHCLNIITWYLVFACFLAANTDIFNRKLVSSYNKASTKNLTHKIWEFYSNRDPTGAGGLDQSAAKFTPLSSRNWAHYYSSLHSNLSNNKTFFSFYIYFFNFSNLHARGQTRGACGYCGSRYGARRGHAPPRAHSSLPTILLTLLFPPRVYYSGFSFFPFFL